MLAFFRTGGNKIWWGGPIMAAEFGRGGGGGVLEGDQMTGLPWGAILLPGSVYIKERGGKEVETLARLKVKPLDWNCKVNQMFQNSHCSCFRVKFNVVFC